MSTPTTNAFTGSQIFESENDYIRRMDGQSEIKFFKTNDTTYEYTSETFTKTSRLPVEMQRCDGSPFVWYRSWNHERITNEAKALQLVARETSVLVPKLLDHGTYSDGRRYLKTTFVEGPRLNTIPRRSCSKPEGQKHTSDTPCKACSDQAYQNALEYISNTVLPQFATMKSQTRGIDGFKTLPLELPEYTFQHGDIAAQNIIVDSQTLKVKALIDFEYAGFYPPGMENWPGTLCSDVYKRRGDRIAALIKEFLAIEYKECCDKWSDKEKLHELVHLGKLPPIDQLGRNGAEG
ncbi:hypothetical protein IQ07DRAFT_608892 [Pyrenochaeta sp. DS3sAY3a]|nr:hypothetical protein IQ07DRAFT_608892 [Pyrenochaeta sp. DS3sAY3a]